LSKKFQRPSPEQPRPESPRVEAGHLSLNEIIGSKKPIAKPTVEIDMSDIFDVAPGQAIFRFVEPGIEETYGIPEQVKNLRRQRPKWPNALCQTLSMMVLAHQYPPPTEGSVWMLYMAAVNNLTLEEFDEFTRRFVEAFPDLFDMDMAVEEAKND